MLVEAAVVVAGARVAGFVAVAFSLAEFAGLAGESDAAADGGF